MDKLASILRRVFVRCIFSVKNLEKPLMFGQGDEITEWKSTGIKFEIPDAVLAICNSDLPSSYVCRLGTCNF